MTSSHTADDLASHFNSASVPSALVMCPADIEYHLAVLAFSCQRGIAPYQSSELRHASAVVSRRYLRSSTDAQSLRRPLISMSTLKYSICFHIGSVHTELPTRLRQLS